MPVDPKIFLSHRFADKQIAHVVRRNLGNWGFDNAIYQASAPGHGPMLGEYITDDIRNALYQSKIVILIYTLTDYDWAFCMWECGLATHPTKTDTRSIVLQCNLRDTPKTFEGQLLVRVDFDSIKNFVIQFHREENFFPGEKAFRPDITDETIENLSAAFHKELEAVIPPGTREERNRWDFITVQLKQDDARAVLEYDIDDAMEHVLNGSVIIKDFGEALKHFGYVNLEPELRLSHLAARWSERTEDREKVSKDWIKELASEIYRALENSPASPSWKKLNSVNYRGSWFYPVVNHARVLPDGSMELDIYLYRSITGSGQESRSASSRSRRARPTATQKS